MNPIPDFTLYQAKIIQNYYLNPLWPASNFTYPKAAGFLFAVACTPEKIEPEEWLSVLLPERGELADSPAVPDDRASATAALLTLFDWIREGVREARTALPHGCSAAAEPMDNFAPGASLSEWSQGLFEGYCWTNSEEWIRLVPEEMRDEADSVLVALTFFATREMAEDYWTEASDRAEPFEKMAGSVSELFLKALAEYAAFAVAIGVVLEEEADAEEAEEEPPPSRNAPCPCGSGRKYKGCCGRGTPR